MFPALCLIWRVHTKIGEVLFREPRLNGGPLSPAFWVKDAFFLKRMNTDKPRQAQTGMDGRAGGEDVRRFRIPRGAHSLIRIFARTEHEGNNALNRPAP